MSGVTDALNNAMSTASSSSLEAIGSVLPYALAIMAAVIVITVAIRIFKRTAK